jgi:hypothetical protein
MSWAIWRPALNISIGYRRLIISTQRHHDAPDFEAMWDQRPETLALTYSVID